MINFHTVGCMQWTKCSLDEDLLMEDSASSCKSENLLAYGISPSRGLQPIGLLFMEYESGRGPFITHKEHDLLGITILADHISLTMICYLLYSECTLFVHIVFAMFCMEGGERRRGRGRQKIG